MVCLERKNLSRTRRKGCCTTRNPSRVVSSASFLFFPSVPPPSLSLPFPRAASAPNPTLSHFCWSGCRNCSTSAATYSQRITRVPSMDSISRTNEHSLPTSYYSTRTTYDIHTNASPLQQQQRNNNLRTNKCQSCRSVRQQ
jgi:hypothetical protein